MARVTEVPTVHQQCREIADAARFFQAAILEYGTLDPVVRDLCRLKSANLNACKF